MKQIVFTKKDTVELLEVEVPELDNNQVRVETVFSSISCGTERANLIGEQNISIWSDEPVKFPRYTGYSSAGIVVEVGSEVTTVKPGDRVCMSWSEHKQYNVLDEKSVFKIEDASISLQEAALCNIGTFSMAAIRKTELEIGESMLVMGLGILGLMAVSFAHAAGAVPVIAVDPVAERREKTLKFGADYAFDPFDKDFVKNVMEITGGGVNAAIEVTGSGAGLNECLDCMAKFGRIALLGCTRDSNFTVDYYKKVHGPGVKLIGAHTHARPQCESSRSAFTQRDDVCTILRLCSGKRIDLKGMIDEVYSPEDCHEVYARLINDKNFPTVSQFDWRTLK